VSFSPGFRLVSKQNISSRPEYRTNATAILSASFRTISTVPDHSDRLHRPRNPSIVSSTPPGLLRFALGNYWCFPSSCASRIDLVLSRKVPNLIGGIGGSEMAKQVVCPPCGEVIRGESDDELVTNVMDHAKNHGHELGDSDRAEILSGATEV
jgi:hypothetical protein